MNRRDLLQLAGSTFLAGGLLPIYNPFSFSRNPRSERRLFFHPEEVAVIRANARTPLLGNMYKEWAAEPIDSIARALNRYEESTDMLVDFRAALAALEHSSIVHVVEPSAEREVALLEGIERISELPEWDYFRDGGKEVLGIQWSSFTTVRLLLAREVLGNAVSTDLDRSVLTAIADKGCQTCYNTVYDMDHPETVKGWDFNERMAGFYDITMERWPMILGANNLRAAPTGALGLGALALRGHDDRADEFLRLAETSTERFLKLVSPDGSYFEGLSYLGYSLRTILPFIEAHRRLEGTIDWQRQVNLDGMLEYIVTMQFGRRPDGPPDIVNFSDARHSIAPGPISLIGLHTGNPLAAWADERAGLPRWYFDFMWYDQDAPSEPPPDRLLNHRNDMNWIICRTGWDPDDVMIAFKSGAPANHEHGDRNHITLKAYGERLLNDHFGAPYDRRDPAWKMRFSEGHNALMLDGRSHPYLDGMEGTNDSKAYANIIQYEDHGEHVWWTSDASAAYILDNYHAHQVLRTVLFAKPGVILIADQIRLRYRPQTVDLRFFPDNRDGEARLFVDGKAFGIHRPKASLYGSVVADTSAAPRTSRLDVPADSGDYPCVEIHSPEALTHRVVTVLQVRPTGSSPAETSVDRAEDNWNVRVGDLDVSIRMTSHEPLIRIGS
jgi:hypothetical protein